MGDLKAIGSEKLTGQDKIKRIMEIARYGETSKNTELHIKTNSFTKRAADGNIYAIVHEKDGYYVKSGLNESSLDYVNGLSNKRKNRYRSYSAALKRLNLMLKPINEEYNDGYGDSMYEQEDDEKLVIKTKQTTPPAPAAPAPAAPAPAAPTPPLPTAPAPTGDDMEVDVDMDMGDEDMDMDVDMDMGDEESFDAEEERPTVKSIQKLTGKLGQKMREYEDEMDSDMIKYVLNSLISAVDLDLLDEDDRDDIIGRLEPEEDEYGVEDDFEVDTDIDMDDDMDVDDKSSAPHTKTERVLQIVQDAEAAAPGAGRFLIFSNYESFGKLQQKLEEAGIGHNKICGTGAAIQRQVQKFEEGKTPVLLLNATHYGAGLNLHKASHVILTHRMCADMEGQVIGRAQRTGRSGALQVEQLLHPGE